MPHTIEWEAPYHVSGSVTLAFQGETANMVMVRNLSTGHVLSFDVEVLPMVATFAKPISPKRALAELQKTIPIDEAQFRQALETLCATETLVPWRSSVSKEDALAAMSSIDRWYHTFEIVPGLFAPGDVPAGAARLNLVGVPQDLSGQRILDVGARDGGYSFELERRGAEVVSYDIQHSHRTGFEAARQIIGSSATYIQGNVYDLSPETAGLFDAVLYFGVFYHLKNPLSGFTNIYGVLKEEGILYVEGAVLDTSHLVDERLHGYRQQLEALSELPLTYFTSADYHGNWTNWFVPNVACLKEWLHATGFRNVQLGLIGGNRAGGNAVKDASFDPIEHEIL